MNRKTWLAGALVAALAFTLGTVVAQEGEGEGGGFEMPEWTKLTEQHEMLKESVGEYDVVGEFTMAPGAPPQTFHATAKREMILDGRFVKETFVAEMPGMPFEGLLIEGYDTIRKKFMSVWMDSTSPVAGVSWGNEKDGVLILHGEMPDMMTGQLKKTKYTVTTDSEDQATMTMYDIAEDGSEVLSMKLVYTRKGESED